MKLSFRVLLLTAATLAAFAQQPMPRMTTVDPMNGKAGDEITVSGENLEKSQVAKVYLLIGQTDLPVDVTEQTANNIKFKIPAKATAGRFALEILTTDKPPRLIEQPVKLTVEQ